MTDYEKWDSYVANLDLSSSGEDEDKDEKKEVVVGDADGCKAFGDTQEKGKYGWGKPLDEKGQIDRSGDLTVGNAKGNALSTNKTPQKVFRITEWDWTQTGDAVKITLDISKARMRCVSDMTQKLDFTQDMIRAKMREREVDIRCYDQENLWELAFGLSGLPGIDPNKSSFALGRAPGKGPGHVIVVNLVKRTKEHWEGCGKEKTFESRKKSLPVESVTQYSWSDSEQYATVYLKIPGLCPGVDEDCIEVRYRELSFDVKCLVGDKYYCFAVTELPMEIEITKCFHRVKENELRIKLKKWARCTWFKLQVHR